MFFAAEHIRARARSEQYGPDKLQDNDSLEGTRRDMGNTGNQDSTRKDRESLA